VTIEYGRKPYISDSYADMMNDVTQMAMQDQAKFKQSEMDKPYQSSSYDSMESLYPATAFNGNPIYDANFDVPWMGISGGPFNASKLPRGFGRRGGPALPPVVTGCRGAKIGYTTLSMNVGQVQNLTVKGPGGLDYNWELDGGGTLIDNGGEGAVYYAPSDNPDCGNNAIITLFVAAEVCDSIMIGINAYTKRDQAAYRMNVCQLEALCYYTGATYLCEQGQVIVKSFYCDGTPAPLPYLTCSSCSSAGLSCMVCWAHLTVPPCTLPGQQSCAEISQGACGAENRPIGQKYDVRTPGMITLGCCPSLQ